MGYYIIILALLLLTGCTNFADMTDAELAEYERSPFLAACTYKNGSATNTPCRGVPALINGGHHHQSDLLPRHNADDYEITWHKKETELEAKKACLNWTGAFTRACGSVDHEQKTAVFIIVDGDRLAMNHEIEAHIKRDSNH